MELGFKALSDQTVSELVRPNDFQILDDQVYGNHYQKPICRNGLVLPVRFHILSQHARLGDTSSRVWLKQCSHGCPFSSVDSYHAASCVPFLKRDTRVTCQQIIDDLSPRKQLQYTLPDDEEPCHASARSRFDSPQFDAVTSEEFVQAALHESRPQSNADLIHTAGSGKGAHCSSTIDVLHGHGASN